MADSTTDDFEPLFDYSRVQPLNFVCIDDDAPDISPVSSRKRKKITEPCVVKVDDEDVEVTKVVNVNEEDWLAPPPMVSTDVSSKIGEDSTIKELRKKKEELLLFAKSSQNMLLEVEESLRRELRASFKSSTDAVAEQPKVANSERAKVVISIQNKDECKQFRVYKDDKFERLFSSYADKAKLDVQSLVFSFDGDKINSADTPANLGMDDDDIIEVNENKR